MNKFSNEDLNNLSFSQRVQFLKSYFSLKDSGATPEEAFSKAKTSLDSLDEPATKTVSTITKSLNTEQRISVEMIYEPFTPDEHGEWMSEDTIRYACLDFNEKLSQGIVKANLFHAETTDTFKVLKTWINEVDCYIGNEGEEKVLVKKGSWLGEFFWEDERVWELKKCGEIGGVSICASGIKNIPEKG